LANTIKQRMIERAAVLLAMKGLQGTSFSEVLEASGAPRGSLYHHFPGGKEELVLAALQVASERAMEVLNRLEGRPATDIAQTFFALWRTVLGKSNFQAGCSVVAVTVAADAPALLERTADIFRAWRTRLAELLAKGGIPAEQAGTLSAMLIAASEGAVILSRAEQSFEPFDLITASQLAAVRMAMGNGAESSA
jgi:TetR/AcrR family transcriptional repressor of lmrAB and yxaGH operons